MILFNHPAIKGPGDQCLSNISGVLRVEVDINYKPQGINEVSDCPKSKLPIVIIVFD